jgi:LPPG:FO 2-phospho-L-lactate transferase
MTQRKDLVVALSGGVGGAKLALGLSRVLPAGQLTIVVNTGDDFDHLGLRICPDIDTLLYTLSGLANPETGWGRRGETWNFMTALGALGGVTWFRLGDLDLATHVERTRRPPPVKVCPKSRPISRNGSASLPALSRCPTIR